MADLCSIEGESVMEPSKSVRKIPILCYHRVHKDDDPEMPQAAPGEYCGHVNVSLFRKQLALLAERGFTAVTHDELAKWIYGEKALPEEPVVCIDFDDNRLNVFENAYPVMSEYGYKGTIFAVSRLADGNLPYMQSFPWMNWANLEKLARAGWAVGAHTASHLKLAQLFNGAEGLDGPKRVVEELEGCNRAIERELGFQPVCFAYPSGDWSEEVEAYVSRYYRTARLWYGDDHFKLNTLSSHPYRLVGINTSMNMSDTLFSRLIDASV